MIGNTLSHFHVIERIGAGGMGVVYRAHDEQLDRDVALKVLAPGILSDEASRRRFRREALALAKLNHPNIESIYEFDTEQGIDFLVMELVSGITLAAKLSTGPLGEKDVLRFGAQLADGLHAAHEQGIIHRDLKPGNLHITREQRLKILDFGLAQWIQTGEENNLAITLTKSQEITGTLPYMAPEQLRGHTADQRTDIYAAGAVLYEMASGKRPHQQTSSPLLISAILEAPLEPPTTHNRQIAPVLENIILKALDKDPNRRYQSARELHIDLERMMTGSTPIVPRRPPQHWRWTIPGAIALMLAAILVVLYLRHLRHGQVAGVQQSQTAPAIMARRSVAVLGFKNLSGKPETAWLSTALAEMLSTELAAGEQVRTIPGENIARMKHDLALEDADSFGQETLEKIRKHLGTDLVVLGSYLVMGNAAGGKLRLDFRLQDAVAGETIASVSETGTEGELLDLVSRSGIEIRQKLGIGQVSASDNSDVRASLPATPEAARLYSEGLAKLRVLDALAARDLLIRAVRADAKHGPSHAALAEAWAALGYDKNAATQGREAVRLAANLSREERLFIEARSHEFSHEWPRAIDIYRTLTGFFPDNLEYGLRLASCQIAAGSGRDALATVESLRRLPAPTADDARIDLAEAHAASSVGDFKRSEKSAARAVEKGRAQGTQLVVAKARSTQGSALERLGLSSESAAAIAEAQTLFTVAGDRVGAATTMLVAGHLLYDKGDFAGALKSYKDSLEVFRMLGNRLRAANSLNNIGNVYYDQGDLVHAKEYYEQAISAYREIDDKTGFAGGLGNLANVLDSMGELGQALQMQLAGLDAFREVGDQRGAGSTLSNLGNLLLEMGDLDGAQARYTEALQIDTQTGYRRGTAYKLFGLADLLTQRDDLSQARQKAEEAANIRHELGEELNSALSQAQLANISMEQGRNAEAEGLIRSAVTQFDKNKLQDNQAAGNALLAMILLKEGKVSEAQKTAELAMALSKRASSRLPRFDAGLAQARTLAASGRTDDALKKLQIMLDEQKKYGYLGYEYMTRLTIGELEMKSGKVAAGRARLESLEKEAGQKGFRLIARKAAKVRAG
ncbi:MAG TPA: protein kinase [Terriglobales bacterium]|nr:protein kinase [Terriglobales bacterium]